MTPGEFGPDETDLQLVHLLQIHPRISWADAAPVLGLSPTAVAARWARLGEAGLAWTAVYPGTRHHHLTAVVEISCRLRRRGDIVHRLSHDPRIVSLDETSGRRDLLLTVMVPDLAALGALILDDVSRLRGVNSVRSGVVTAVHRDGSGWRLDALDREQQRTAEAARRKVSERRSTVSEDSYEALIAGLSTDARRSVAHLARDTAASPSTVQRQLQRILTEQTLALRCDLAPELSGWPVESSWMVTVSPSDKDRVVAALLKRAELAMCLSLTGETNLVFSIRARSIDGLRTFERFVATDLPGLTPTETIVHLRPRKRMGRLLRSDGRATGEVVIPTLRPPI